MGDPALLTKREFVEGHPKGVTLLLDGHEQPAEPN
jgi:hypothetical protein